MLNFTSSVGNYWNRIGKIGLVVKQLRAYQNSQLINLTDTANGVVAQFNAESDLQAIVGSNYINMLNNVGSAGSTMQTLAQQTTNRMIFRDNPRNYQNLQSLTLDTSIQEVIRQMKLAGASILAMPVTATPGTFTGTGNGVIVASVKRPLDGLTMENSFSETLNLVCNRDSFLGGTLAGNEGFLVNGAGSQPNPFAFNWPLGSNGTTSLNAINGLVNNSQGNLLTNSGFDIWASGVPSNFTANAGVSGTNFAQENTIIYDGASALRIIGDGTSNFDLRQQFASATGTNGTLRALTQYSINLWLRTGGSAPAAGVLSIDLIDGNGIIIKDANAVNNTFTVSLPGLNTSYISYSGAFRTPTSLPAAQYLRLRLTTPLTTGAAVYLDKLSFGAMTQVYTSGPFIAVHAGNVPFVQNDLGTCVINNGRGAGGTLDTFQTLAFRLFYPDMQNQEFLIPSSAAPTISDGLIS